MTQRRCSCDTCDFREAILRTNQAVRPCSDVTPSSSAAVIYGIPTALTLAAFSAPERLGALEMRFRLFVAGINDGLSEFVKKSQTPFLFECISVRWAQPNVANGIE